MLIFGQKSFQFCIPYFKTRQPVLPYIGTLAISKLLRTLHAEKKFVAAKQSVLCQQQRWLCQTFAPLIFILRLNLIAEFSCSSLFFFIQKKLLKSNNNIVLFFYSFFKSRLRVAQEKREQLFPTVQWM